MIQPKSKPCKGTGVASGLGCGIPTLHRVYGLGKMCGCYSDFLLKTEPGKVIMQKAMLKVSKPRLEVEKNKAEMQNAEKFKKDRQKLSYLLVNVRTVCHEFIRKRDKYRPCISCGAAYDTTFQAGHFFKAELFSNLKFNEKNIHGQCKRCNMFNDGNESGYRVGLMQRYGKEFLHELNEMAGDSKKNDYHWDREELEKIRIDFKTKLNNL